MYTAEDTISASAPDNLEFIKVEGLGNDFLLLDLRDRHRDPARARKIAESLRPLAPRLCHRRTGVGGDGLLIVCPPDDEREARGRMIVINHDGSRPEMCGNGLRCVALHLVLTEPEPAHGQAEASEFHVSTDVGELGCLVSELDRDGRSAQVSVAMGPARRLGRHRPAAAPNRTFYGISMGNPHAVTFVGNEEDPRALAHELGPLVERDPLYPDRTNVEFVRREPNGVLTTWVWERGCGITQACGTGACAVVAAAVDLGLATSGRKTTVRLPGGPLTIRARRSEKATVIMTGPAREVFRGDMWFPA